MKRLFAWSLVSISLWLIAECVCANPVSETEALMRVHQFMPDKHFSVKKYSPRFASSQTTPPFYIFNADDGGFVVVSGDDRTTPVLGYSEHGQLDLSQAPENLLYWLDSYAQQIESLDHGASASTIGASLKDAAPISPLIQTKWSQGAPYNNQCPNWPGTDQRCLTGCVATCMAQIMYYYKWPEHCPPIPAYFLSSFNQTIEALPPVDFRWNDMQLTYYNNDVGPAADAVAQLMRYCGQSVEMDYGRQESSAYMDSKVMIETFDYSENTKEIYRNNYSDATEWESIIYQELAKGHPVPYEGQSKESGHQFICDGYDNRGYFHINWGWGGQYDAYYVLSVANPYTDGRSGYSQDQRAIIGLEPKAVPSDYAVNSFSIVEDIFLNEKTDVRVSLTNLGNTSRERLVLWVKQRRVWALTATVDGSIEPGQTGEVMMSFIPSNVGNFEVKLTSDLEGEVVKATATIHVAEPEEKTVGDFVYLCNNDTHHAFVKGTKEDADTKTWVIPETFDTDGVTYTVVAVRSDAFFYDSRVRRLELPSTLNMIGDEAVLNCNNLQMVISHIKHPFVIHDNTFAVRTWNYDTMKFDYKESSAVLYVPEGSKSEYEAIPGWTHFAKVVEGIPHEVFAGGLRFLCMPNTKTATVIADDSYSELTEVNIPEQVECEGIACLVDSIADKAFRSSRYLKFVTLPSSLKTIGENAFYSCYRLKEVNIPEGCETIGSSAFAYCSDLQKVVLPATLSSLGDKAFGETSALVSVISHCKSPCQISENVFCISSWNEEMQSNEYKPSPATLYVPVGRKDDYIAKGWDQFAKIEEGELVDAVIGGLKYQLQTKDKTAIVLQDESYEELTEVNIPERVKYDGTDYLVIGIADDAFRECRITSVTFPSTLKSIGNNAFCNCYNIKELNIPEGCETIGRSAFVYCNDLQKVVLPATLTSLGDYAFRNNKLLISVFSYCKSPCHISEHVFCIESWNPETSAYDYNPSPATLYVPVGSKAEYIAKGWDQFAKISEGEPEEAVIDGLRYQLLTAEKTAIVLPDESYQEFTEVNIPEQVEYNGVACSVIGIAEEVFNSCFKITSITLPSTLKSIGESAFAYCRYIKELNIPEGCETIGNSAFFYCSELRKLVLPTILPMLGDNAFGETEALASVVSHCKSPCQISENVFGISSWNSEKHVYEHEPSPATFYVPVGCKAEYIDKGWDQFAKIEEGEPEEAVLTGLRYQFLSTEKTAIVFPDESYQELTEVNIPERVEYDGTNYLVVGIANAAFYDCSSITSVTFPSTLKAIGRSAFTSCRSLQELNIPEGCEAIGRKAFAYCSGLKKIVLPATLSCLDNDAFEATSALISVISHCKTPCSIGEHVFKTWGWNEEKQGYYYNSSPAILYVPVGCKAEYIEKGWDQFIKISEGEPEEAIIDELRYQLQDTEKTAIVLRDESYYGFTEVNIPERVKYNGSDYLVVGIAKEAFNSCSHIESVILPSSLKSIGESAFLYCIRLKEINIPKGCETIGRSAFGNCRGLQKIVLPATLSSLGNNAFAKNSALVSVFSYCKSPCHISENVFSIRSWNEETQSNEYIPSPATLYVPIGSKDDYIAKGWDQFAAIVEDEECGIGCVIEDGHQTDDGTLYNPFGQRVTNPQKGIFIRNGKIILIER